MVQARIDDGFLCCSHVDTSVNFPTELVYFSEVCTSPELVAKILKVGPCQPGQTNIFKFPQEEDGRSFCKDWYKTQDGKYDRDWLIYVLSCMLAVSLQGDLHFSGKLGKSRAWVSTNGRKERRNY